MKRFLKHCADLGSVICYLFVIVALLFYPSTGIAWIAAFGFACAMYSHINNKNLGK